MTNTTNNTAARAAQAPQGDTRQRAPYGPDNPPRLRMDGESVKDYRIAMGWDKPETATRIRAYQHGQWFDARTVDEMQEFYLSRLPAIREAAREHGYAIGLHGSTRRDFDLMAMQWREDASDKDTLARAIAEAACGIRREGAYDWEAKPEGRVATSIPICWTDHANPDFDNMVSAGHIDLSVIDTTPAAHTCTPADERARREQENSEFTAWWNEKQACPEHSITTENAAHAAWQERGRRATQGAGTAPADANKIAVAVRNACMKLSADFRFPDTMSAAAGLFKVRNLTMQMDLSEVIANADAYAALTDAAADYAAGREPDPAPVSTAAATAGACTPVWQEEDGNMGDRVVRCQSCGTYQGNPWRRTPAAGQQGASRAALNEAQVDAIAGKYVGMGGVEDYRAFANDIAVLARAPLPGQDGQAVDDAIVSKIAEFYPQETPRDMEKNQRLARAIQRLPSLRAAQSRAQSDTTGDQQPAPIERDHSEGGHND
jgi:hypothetical protein